MASCPTPKSLITKPVVRWALTSAFPAKWEGPLLKGKGTEVAIETLELAHEGLEWVD
jgi:phage tail-like protein